MKVSYEKEGRDMTYVHRETLSASPRLKPHPIPRTMTRFQAEEESMNLTAILDRAARLFPDNPAVRRGSEPCDYRQLGKRVARLAGSLKDLGLSPGDRVAALLRNVQSFLEIYFAAPAAGLVLVPVNHRLSSDEVGAIFEDADVSAVVAEPRFAETVDGALQDGARPCRVWATEEGDDAPPGETLEALLGGSSTIPPERWGAAGRDDPAQIYYTSGTTGEPKGVVLTHGNVSFHALMAAAELSLSEQDVWLHAAPLFHLADAWATFALTWVGGSHVMAPDFDEEAVLDLFESEGITLTNLIPTMLNRLVNHPGAPSRDFSALRVMLSGGAPISPQLVRRIMDTFGCDYLQTYGLTETSPYLTLSKLKASLESLPDEEKFWYKACTGRPMLGVEVRVVDENGRDVPADRKTVGEIVARGESVTPGYRGKEEETRRAFRDGWFHTGDLAVLDREGYVNIVDRKKDVIMSGGEQVFSIEVENALEEHADVLEVAVIAVPDETWGEAIKAVVVRREGAGVTAEELISFCRSKLARYKAPKSVDFLAALPKTGSRKINKRVLREPYWEGMERRVH